MTEIIFLPKKKSDNLNGLTGNKNGDFSTQNEEFEKTRLIKPLKNYVLQIVNNISIYFFIFNFFYGSNAAK